MTVAPASRDQWAQLRADVGRLVARRLPTPADVEDVVQEVLLRVWRNGDSLRDGERFGAWLARVAQTAAADQLRARQRHPVPRFETSEDADEGAPESEDVTTKELIATVLRPFVESLPEPYREAILLAELDGLPYPVLAKRLALSVSGVKSRVQRGRALLREALERCCAIALDARGAPLSCELKVGGTVPPGCCASEQASCASPAEAATRRRQPA